MSSTPQKIFITGSTDGLGSLIAQSLLSNNHLVTLHARSPSRANDALRAHPTANGCLVADLSSISQTKRLAQEANEKYGQFDVIMSNAGVGYSEPYKKTEDGLSHVFAINALAPYILAAGMMRPTQGYVFMTSGMHLYAEGRMGDLAWAKKRWNSSVAYGESKHVPHPPTLISFR